MSLSVAKGEICGLLGPNGAGKTTILRIINNLLVSDAGSVLVNGIPKLPLKQAEISDTCLKKEGFTTR